MSTLPRLVGTNIPPSKIQCNYLYFFDSKLYDISMRLISRLRGAGTVHVWSKGVVASGLKLSLDKGNDVCGGVKCICMRLILKM